jgi:hypothetical protein
MVECGEVRDYADLARLGYVTRARITQIMNLLNLAVKRNCLRTNPAGNPQAILGVEGPLDAEAVPDQSPGQNLVHDWLVVDHKDSARPSPVS